MPEAFGIVANVISDKVMRTGAKVWLVTFRGDAKAVVVDGLSKGGRLVQKYMHQKRLENFRAKWIPEHLRYERNSRYGVIYQWATKEQAQSVADDLARMWGGVRSFRSDGTLIRDGITEGEAFSRAQQGR